MSFFKIILAAAVLTTPLATTAQTYTMQGEVLTVEQCVEVVSAQLTFTVVNPEQEFLYDEMIRFHYEHPNYSFTWTGATLLLDHENVGRFSPAELLEENTTYRLVAWAGLGNVYADGDPTPSIVLYVIQQPLYINNQQSSVSPEGSMVWLPAQKRALEADDAANEIVLFVCGRIARHFGVFDS